MGVFGGVLFILLFFIIALSITRLLRTAEKNYVYYMLLGATSALIAETGIHGLIDFDLTSYGSKYFWFPLGFTMAVLNLAKRSAKKAGSAQ
jgi:cell division protein FtsW (lipid II flippase)